MLNGKTILLIEDDEEMRDELGGVLSGQGYAIMSAGDGGTGLAFLRENRCDLVLLDLKLPGLNGREILRIIKREHPRQKVFIVTGSTLSGVRQTADPVLAPADAVINKPFRVEDLIGLITEALG